MLSGESDCAWMVLEQDLQIIRSVPFAEAAFPEFVLNEALILAALGQWSGEFTPLRFPIHPQPALVDGNRFEFGSRRTDGETDRLAAIDCRVARLIPDDFSSDAWTNRVIASMKSDAAKFQLDNTRIPEIGKKLWACADHPRLAKTGATGDAHRVADQLLSPADRLIRSYPDRAASYMLLSEGDVQEAKIAYREDEAPAVERWERKALDAALRAATLRARKRGGHGRSITAAFD